MNTYLTDSQLAQILDKPVFHLIGKTADTLAMECYVVGGYVRDIFLERPSKDIDVVVVGSGIAVAEALVKSLKQEHRKAHLSVYRNFGTAQVKIYGRGEEGDTEVEFVGARKESYDRGSRKPIVEDGTLEEDLDRRDFTINALAICLNEARFGQLVDQFDGLDDMEDRLIRTPLDPDITFSDDPLRMMRCIRFATQLGFQIDEETFAALERNKERIKIISQERIIDELNKIMRSPHPSRGWFELSRCGLLPLIFPELAALEGVETINGKGHKDNFHHTMEVLENVSKKLSTQEQESGLKRESEIDSLWLLWATLLHDIGKPRSKKWEPGTGWTFRNHNFIGEKMVPQIFRRMKLPMDERMKYVQKLVGLHMRPQVIADEEVTDSAVRRMTFEAGPDIDDLMTLCEADITSKNEVKKARFLENFRIVREKIEDLKQRDFVRLFQPCISGDEIMERYQLTPCREVGTLKQALKDAILDGDIQNEREPALAFLDHKWKEMNEATH